MDIIIGNKKMTLSPQEVKAARKAISGILEKCKDASEENRSPTFYYTFLIMMHVMSNDQIKAITPDVMSKFYEAKAKNDKRQQTNK